jgi:hypothetical protein
MCEGCDDDCSQNQTLFIAMVLLSVTCGTFFAVSFGIYWPWVVSEWALTESQSEMNISGLGLAREPSLAAK